MAEGFDELEEHVSRLVEAHDRLLGLVRLKRAATAAADAGELLVCCEREDECVRWIAGLERARRELTRRLASSHGLVESPSLVRLTEHTDPPRRGRLLALRERLLRTTETIQEENGAARRATRALLRHMGGVIQQIAQATGERATYSRRGIEGRPPAAGSFTVTG